MDLPPPPPPPPEGGGDPAGPAPGAPASAPASSTCRAPSVPALETLAMDRYLHYLEGECATYVALTQAPSVVLKGAAERLLQVLKQQLRGSMSGLASSVLREKMLSRVLSHDFPSEAHCFRTAMTKADRAVSPVVLGAPLQPPPPPILGLGPAAAVGHHHHQQLQHAHHVQALQALGATCTSPCCTGSFIQETMAGILLNADVREVIFCASLPMTTATARRMMLSGAEAGGAQATSLEQQQHAQSSPFVAEFKVSAVLSHLLAATQDCPSQLRRLVFTENFVREEDSSHVTLPGPLGGLIEGSGAMKCRDLMLSRVRRRQERFQLEFCRRGLVGCGSGAASGGQVGASETDAADRQPNRQCGSEAAARIGDRRGLTLNVLALFRNVAPTQLNFPRLTELCLKNNVQCELYSKANFQFEFLARIGYSCPNLKILDIFGTDTWADCLVAFFFRDAFHTLHRYLFFMENEEDETSGYHPHDLNRYCQFCLDQMHPNVIERPFTVNPVIPLLDEIYNHVVKKYPKRSYCILRNCVKVSELLLSIESNVYELVRRDNMSDYVTCEKPVGSAAVSRQSTQKRADDPRRGKARGAREQDREHILGRLRPRTRDDLSARQNRANKAVIPWTDDTNDGARGGSKHDGSGRQLRQLRSRRRDNNAQSTDRHHADAGILNSPHQRRLKTTKSCLETAESEVSGTIVTRSRKRKLEDADAIEKGRSTKSTTVRDQGSRLEPKLVSSESLSGSKRGKRSTKRKPVRAKDGRQPSPVPPSLPNMPGEKDSSWPTLGFVEWDRNNGRCFCEDNSCASGEADSDGGVEFTSSSSQCSSTSSCGRPLMSRALSETLSGHRTRCKSMRRWNSEADWVEPEFVQYRQISGWPHLNDCVRSLEVLNIGGTNVLGEFVPFVLSVCPRLRSLGQWLNTTIYGLEILRRLPGRQHDKFEGLVEISYSTDRNYFCQPYIGFVPETKDFLNVRKEMVRMSGRLSKRIKTSRKLDVKRSQVREDVDLLADAFPRIRKLNLVVHHKAVVLEDDESEDEVQDAARKDDNSGSNCPWASFSRLKDLAELDLVTMRFANIKSLLRTIGPSLSTLTLEMGEEQGVGSEIVHLGRSCPNLRVLKLILGDNVLKGEMTLHFGSQFFRKLEHLTVEGSVHLHAFAFLWGHCRRLRHMRVGLVISNELTNTNMLIHDVFTLLFQVNAMPDLEEFHVRNLKIRSLQMGKFLLDSLPKLRSASNWLLDLSAADVVRFRQYLEPMLEAGLQLQYREW